MFGFGKKKKKRNLQQYSLEEAGFSDSPSSGGDGERGARGGPPAQTSSVTVKAELSEGVHTRSIPKYIEAWGWAASSARFRGVLVLILSFLLCCMVVVLLMTNSMLSRKNYIVVALTSDGQPSVLARAGSFNPGPELFIQHFAGKFLSYSGQTVDANMSESMRMATDGFRASWDHRYGREFIGSVKRNRIVQVTSISNIEIKNLEARQFTAEVWSLRYRNSETSNETKEEKLKYEIDVFRGDPTESNPWGMYVNAIRESAYK